MKIILVFFSMIATTMMLNCQSTPKKTAQDITVKKSGITAIQLTEQTRGMNKLYTITEKEIKTSENNNITTTPLESSSWQRITALLATVNYKNSDKFPAPSNGRSSDRVASSQLIFLQGKEKFASDFFDAGNPPQELQQIYAEVLKALGKNVKKPKSGKPRSN